MTKQAKARETLDSLFQRWSDREGLDNERMAERLSISVRAVQNWRTGVACPPRTKWALLATHCGCSLDEIALAIAQEVRSVTTPVHRARRTLP